MSPLFTILATWIQPGTLSLVGVILLFQQVRFQGKRLDELKTDMRELRAETNAKLDRTDAKLDRALELLVAQSSAREAVGK